VPPLVGAYPVKKVTLGVMMLSRARVHIDPAVCFLAVGTCHPGRAVPPKGGVVHPLKTHASWVQYVARQYGGIYKDCRKSKRKVHQVREER
jgi:hypothetical protein